MFPRETSNDIIWEVGRFLDAMNEDIPQHCLWQGLLVWSIITILHTSHAMQVNLLSEEFTGIWGKE